MNALPLLLVGGAALLIMGRKKNGSSTGEGIPAKAQPGSGPAPVTKYPPPAGKVFEASNVMQFATIDANPDAIALVYNPAKASSRVLRAEYGRIAAASRDVEFVAIPLEFLEFIIKQSGDALKNSPMAKTAAALKSRRTGAQISWLNDEALMSNDLAAFQKQMEVAIAAVRKGKR